MQLRDKVYSSQLLEALPISRDLTHEAPPNRDQATAAVTSRRSQRAIIKLIWYFYLMIYAYAKRMVGELFVHANGGALCRKRSEANYRYAMLCQLARCRRSLQPPTLRKRTAKNEGFRSILRRSENAIHATPARATSGRIL
jgi:hypothetical protein